MHKDWFEDDNEIRLLHRGKRRLLDIVFGRTMVITLLLVLQIAIMVLGAHYLGRYYPALTIVLRVMSVAVIIYLVNKSGSVTTKITCAPSCPRCTTSPSTRCAPATTPCMKTLPSPTTPWGRTRSARSSRRCSRPSTSFSLNISSSRRATSGAVS